MAGRNVDREDDVTHGTGNVFADLGFPDAAERQAKLRLAFTLNQIVERRTLTQAEAAKLLGVTPAEGVGPSKLQDRRVLGRTADDLPERARPGRADRDQPEASLPAFSSH